MVTNLCRTLGCLPGPGGLFDQDPYWVEVMSLVIAAQNEQEEMEAAEIRAQTNRTRSRI